MFPHDRKGVKVSGEKKEKKKVERELKAILDLLNILISMSMLKFPLHHSIYQNPFKTPEMEMSIEGRVSDNPQYGLKNGLCRAHTPSVSPTRLRREARSRAAGS